MTLADSKSLILVVDDNSTNLQVLCDLFRGANLRVLIAKSGEAALDILAITTPDLILLDIRMPGITGFETCRRIKENPLTQDIPIVFMTALAETEDKVTGFQLGAVDYITKPFQKDEVLARIHLQLQLRHLTRSLAEKNDQLKQLNESLEDRIQKRTQELSESREALRLSEAYRRMLFETAPIGLALCRMDGQLIEVNPAYAALIGRSIEETLQLSYWDITPQKYAADEQVQLQSLAEKGCYGPYEKEYIHQNGELIPVQLSGLLIEQHGEQFIWSSVADIRDRKRYEAGLQQANERLATMNQELERTARLKDEFLATMSHELRTPLNAILGMSEGLKEEIFGALNERQLVAISTIECSGDHLLELIDDILDLSKIESGQLELTLNEVQIDKLCQSSLTFIQPMALQKKLHLSARIPPTIGTIQADERRLRQVLINLLSNAVKFTPEGGSIVLAVNRIDKAIEVSVTDTGIGIASEDLGKLFHPFVQIDSRLNRQYSGTGLGLALARRFVELQGGTIRVESRLNDGSCFTICLPTPPRTEAEMTQASDLERAIAVTNRPDKHDGTLLGDNDLKPSLPESHTLRSRPPLLLVAEDNQANVESMSNYLVSKGYQLILAKNGQEAVNFARTQHPDLILMDIQMPEMDGLEATRLIRADQSLTNIPIIALTAFALPEDRDKYFHCGFSEYMEKPVRLKYLAARIQQILQR